MPKKTRKKRKMRTPLSRDRVLAAAVALADQEGLDAVSMRKVGQQLGVEAMSLYNHVANKDDILDGIVDIVVGEIELPRDDDDWKTGMLRRARSHRDMFRRHPWALWLMESRTNPGPTSLGYYDAVIGCLRKAGFPIALAAHAFAVLDSFIYGFVVQEQSLPFDSPEGLEELADGIFDESTAEHFPHLTELAMKHTLQPGYSFANEFEYGLELVLEGLERRLGAG